MRYTDTGKIKDSDAFSEVEYKRYNPATISGCVRVYILYIICFINKLINNSMFDKIITKAQTNMASTMY